VNVINWFTGCSLFQIVSNKLQPLHYSEFALMINAIWMQQKEAAFSLAASGIFGF
jgi:hypothetical protein